MNYFCNKKCDSVSIIWRSYTSMATLSILLMSNLSKSCLLAFSWLKLNVLFILLMLCVNLCYLLVCTQLPYGICWSCYQRCLASSTIGTPESVRTSRLTWQQLGDSVAESSPKALEILHFAIALFSFFFFVELFEPFCSLFTFQMPFLNILRIRRKYF